MRKVMQKLTNMTEAKLAREAEMRYATVAMVTDFDCWHPDHGAVEVAAVLEILNHNRERGQKTVAELAKLIGPVRSPSPDGIDSVLDFAIVTAPEARDADVVKKLQPIAGRVLG